MNFDYISQKDSSIDFGIVKGNNKIVFVKAGLGGSYLGYEEKYLKIAHHLNEKHGCSVITVSNLNDNRSHTAIDRAIMEEYVTMNNICSPEFFFFGHSNGGIKGLELSSLGIRFSKMVLINMPLMINIHKTKRYFSMLNETDITLVYGQFDPSFSYIPFIENKYKNIKIVSVAGADHNFKGLTKEFVELSDILMS